MTRHREQILNMINASCSHMTAKQIFEQIKKSDRSIARATVYNSLNYLTQTGQIRRVKVQGECDRYDRISHDHDHFVCDRCGKMIDCEIPNLGEYLHEKTGAEILSYELNLHVICEDCKKK